MVDEIEVKKCLKCEKVMLCKIVDWYDTTIHEYGDTIGYESPQCQSIKNGLLDPILKIMDEFRP